MVFQVLDREGLEDRQYFIREEDKHESVELTLPSGRYSIQLEQRVLFSRPPRVEKIGEAREVEIRGGESLSWILP